MKKIVCRHCKSIKVVFYGDFIKLRKDIIRTFKCLDCGKATAIKQI